MTPPTSSGFGTTMRTSRKSYSRKTLTHVSPGSMISSSTSDSDNSLHSLYFTSYHGLINYPQKIPACEAVTTKKYRTAAHHCGEPGAASRHTNPSTPRLRRKAKQSECDSPRCPHMLS